MKFVNENLILFEKKLGKNLLVELKQDNINGKLIITLFKKWNKNLGFESTDYIMVFEKEERKKALSIYNQLSLKNIYKLFNK